jgi:hypothetical protein
MKNTTYIDIQFKGKGLIPLQLAQQVNLPIVSVVSAGEIAKIGRYKGGQSPYGIGLLKIQTGFEELNRHIDWLYQNKEIISANYVDEIVVDIHSDNSSCESVDTATLDMVKLNALHARVQVGDLMNSSDSVTQGE